MSEKDKKSALDTAVEVVAFGALGYAAKESDFVKSGKAAIAGEAIVDAVKNLPKTLGTASSDVLYALGTAEAKINEAIGVGALNDLTLKSCGVVEDVPVLKQLSAPICQATKDVVAKRGK
jgi:hypothetical protein